MLTHIGDTGHGDFGLAIKPEATGILSRTVLPGVGPINFAVESARHNAWVIKELFEDLLWEAIYDGSSMRLSYVTLCKSPGSRLDLVESTVLHPYLKRIVVCAPQMLFTTFMAPEFHIIMSMLKAHPKGGLSEFAPAFLPSPSQSLHSDPKWNLKEALLTKAQDQPLELQD
ncbi:hypothetical protein B0H14DRAFT_3133925 [Mycena olivaceomarginata]|nr:hypothetical protein B0H14DRAFT_3133925 [Mycena olivaceomarginata]